MSLVSGLLERLVASTRRTRRDVRSRPPSPSRPSSKRSDSPRRYALSRTGAGCNVSAAGRFNGSAISFIFMTLAPWASYLALGSLDVAHQPDEYVPKDDLARAALIYRDIAIAMMQP